jgi:hypothetical protein
VPTELPPELEKAAREYFSEAHKNMQPVKGELSDPPTLGAISDLASRLRKYDDCFFMTRGVGEASRVLLCPSDGLAALFDQAVLDLDVVSIVRRDGALTFSANRTADGGPHQLHLVGLGVFAIEVEGVANAFSGVIYR